MVEIMPPFLSLCTDIDECAETPGLCQQQCHNVWGSYRCSCERGFHLHSDNRSCIDVDECQVHKDRRLCVGDCLNTPGSYKCTCPAGYKLGKDGRACIGGLAKARVELGAACNTRLHRIGTVAYRPGAPCGACMEW